MHDLIQEIVESNYDIGRISEVSEIYGGFNNRSFRAGVVKDGIGATYLVRRYRSQCTLGEIQFEHKLITYARGHGMEICAGLINSRDGETIIGAGDSGHWCICEYLPGIDKYSWTATDLTDAEFRNAARVLADYHNAVRHFDPASLKRAEPPICELLKMFPDRFRRLAKNRKGEIFDRYYRSSVPEILEVIDRNTPGMEEIEGLPLLPVHCDFHPGNLKWENEKVVGLFDFDWAKMDYRLFDLCLAVVYCCSQWGGSRDGELRLDKFSIYFNAYQDRLRELGGLAPVEGNERALFPKMLASANLYLIHWEATDYYGTKGADERQYLGYLKHNTRLMHWIGRYESDVADTVCKVNQPC